MDAPSAKIWQRKKVVQRSGWLKKSVTTPQQHISLQSFVQELIYQLDPCAQIQSFNSLGGTGSTLKLNGWDLWVESFGFPMFTLHSLPLLNHLAMISPNNLLAPPRDDPKRWYIPPGCWLGTIALPPFFYLPLSIDGLSISSLVTANSSKGIPWTKFIIHLSCVADVLDIIGNVSRFLNPMHECPESTPWSNSWYVYPSAHFYFPAPNHLFRESHPWSKNK